MEFLVVLIAWWVLSPFLKFFYQHPFLFFLLLVTGAFLYRRRRLRNSQPQASSTTHSVGHSLVDLSILRVELVRQLAAGTIDQDSYTVTVKEIDSLCETSLADLQVTPDSQRWRDGREAAWQLLIRQQANTAVSPPWSSKSSTDTGQQLSLPLRPRTSSVQQEHVQQPIKAQASPSQTQTSQVVTVPLLPDETATLLKQTPTVPTIAPGSALHSTAVSPPISQTSVVEPETDRAEAWALTPPSVLERTLQTVSGWPALLVPFLVQNILWFICGLCFVAGSTSLIASTSGQANTLAVSLVLLTYSGFLLWVGYRLCRTRPELTTSGVVLLALGVLLIPLNIASAVRLLATAQTISWLALGICLTAGELFGFYYATMLVSGVMDRFLQGRHPQLFLALTAMQVMVPILNWTPSWTLVAISHCVLLGILAYGALQFTHDWLHSMLSERRKVGYYAVGTLVYAAVVSCVHVTWGAASSVALPAGYASPFLMAVCGLLFYVDAQLKHWTQQYTFLSYLSFILYGLSLVALLLSINTPYINIVTLCLALVVYSVVVWQYQTFAPLILLLGCTSWLYYTLILQQLEPQWHLLASLPALVSFLMATRWLQRHRETSLFTPCYQIGLGVTLTLCFWSIGWTSPGFVALATILVTISFVYYVFGFVPPSTSQMANGRTPNLRYSSWLYIVTGLSSIAIAYSPQWPLVDWTVQTASGMILLSVFWAALGLRLRSHGKAGEACLSEVLLNSTLLNLGFALLLTATVAISGLTYHRLLPVLLLAIGSILLWLSLALRTRGLFYGALLLWGFAGITIKWTYFPHAGSGAVEMALALVTWSVLWWLEHESEESHELRQAALEARAQRLPPLCLLWRFPIASESPYGTLLRLPLQQTMVLLWLVGVSRLVIVFLGGTTGWGWTFAAIMGMVGAVLGAGYFRIPLFLTVAVWLGLGAWFTVIRHFGFTYPAELGLAGVLFSFMVWKLSSITLIHPHAPQLAAFLHLAGNRRTSEMIIHWTTIVSGIGCAVISLLFVGVCTPSLALFCTLLSLIIFLGLAGWYYQKQAQSYLTLAVVSLALLLSYSWSVLPLHDNVHSLFRDHRVGLLAAITGLVFWVSAWELTIQQARLQTEGISRLWHLYHDPLCHTALFLSVFALNQQLALTWLNPLQGGTTLTLLTLLLASGVLFCSGFTLGHLSLQIAATLLIVLVVLWGESLLVHTTIRFNIWPGGTGAVDQWLTLSLAATGLALLACRFRQQPERQAYAVPISWAATITYTWASLGTLLFSFSDPFRPDLCISLSLFTLGAGLFPLLQPLTEASRIRSVALPLLSYPLLISILTWTPFAHQPNASVVLWGFSLWIVANFVLPRWNTQHPQWAVTRETWPWFGLLAIGLSLVSSFFSLVYFYSNAPSQHLVLLQHSGYITGGAVYCFLMLRNSSWGGFPWIAVFLLTRVGSLLLAAWWAAPLSLIPETSIVRLPLHPSIGELLWLNFFLLIVPWWCKQGEAFAAWLGWQQHNLPQPFVLLPAGYFVLRLMHFAVLISTDTTNSVFPSGEVQWLGLFAFSTLLTLSFMHLWCWHKHAWVGHAFLLSLLCTLFVAWAEYVSPVFHVPFFLALWSAALRVIQSLWENRQWGDESTENLQRVLSQWVIPSLATAIGSLLVLPVPLYEQLLTLLVLIDTAAVLGWQRQQRRWLFIAAGMSFVFLHDWPLLWIPFSQITLLLPWYALQLAIIAWLLLLAGQTAKHRLNNPRDNNSLPVDDPQSTLTPLLSWLWQISAAVASVEWALHELTLFSALTAGYSLQWLSTPGDICAALVAAALLLGLGIRQAGITERPQWIYGIAIFAGAVGFYVRLVFVGLAPASVWDTTALLMTAYAILILHHFVRLTPLLHIAMVIPLLLCVTIPFQLASAHAGTALIAATTLYLLMYRETERGFSLYFAFVTVNAALYLWIPVWAVQYKVMQLYLTPATLSVLLLAHLHRHEMSPHVLNGIRLAASATLYVSATSDVFFHPGVGIFLVALALSLAGVLVGIASRIRAFLYTGIASLVGNIGWQLIMLFPEQRLSQAVILLVLAGILAGAMTWFNVQREEILRRVRIFRSDLETWA